MSLESAGVLDRTGTVSRPQADAEGIGESYVDVGTYPCSIQPASPEETLQHDATFGSAFNAFFDPDADIKVGDRFTDDAGVKYGVRGMQDWGSNPRAPHKQVMLIKGAKA